MKPLYGLMLVLILAGCGAAATLPPEETPALNRTFSQAVWVSNVGDHAPWVFSTKDNAIIVSPSTPQANYVHGAYLVDVPDVENVAFDAKVGVLDGSSASVSFQLYAQKGLEFALLGEISLNAFQAIQPFQVDLNEFRGQKMILILGLSSSDISI